MISQVLAVAAVSALLSASGPTLSRRMTPSVAAKLYTAVAVLVAGISTSLLAVVCWYGAARFAVVAWAGGWSAGLLSRTAPVALPASIVAGVFLMTIVGSWVRMWVTPS